MRIQRTSQIIPEMEDQAFLNTQDEFAAPPLFARILESAVVRGLRLQTRRPPIACGHLTARPHSQSLMPEASQWETNIPNQLGDLMRAIEEMDRRLTQWGAGADARYLAQLAVEELGTNIIKYGYDDQNGHSIRLSAACEEGVFRIRVEDDGHEFNPCLTAEPDPDLSLQERTPGGWGLSLVRRMAAGMEYERRGDRNVVTVLVSRVA